MGLFNKKKPEIGPPVFTDMRIAEEQLPPEVNAQLRDKGALFLQPDELSVWALSTLLADNDPNISLLPQDADPSSGQIKKVISQIQIPLELMDALVGNGDPNGLVLEFDTWERTILRPLEFDDGGTKPGFLGYITDGMGLTEKDFHALIVPDYTGKSGAPGQHFNWYVLLHPQPHNGLDYIVFGECPPVGLSGFAGYDAGLALTGEIFNRGKAIPGLVKVFLTDEGTITRYYLPHEVVEATGWWADEVEGIPSTLPNKH
jgi:hypothetical protein